MIPAEPPSDEESRLQVVSRRLAAIVEFSNDAIIGKDLNGIITSWNRGAEKILGYTAEEMVGTSIMRLIPPDRQGDEEHILGKIRNGESIEHFETKRLTKDGRLIDVSITASPIKDSQGRVIGVSKVARDITEHRRNDQQLKLLGTCVANLNDIILITEADPLDEPGPRIVFVNEAFERVTGYTMAETLGRSPRFLQGPKSDRAVLQEIRHALQEHRPIRREMVNYWKDGSERLVDIDLVPIFSPTGACTHFVAIQRDITEKKKIEEQLQWRTAVFEAQLHSSADGVLIVDSGTKKVLQNQRMVELWNIPRDFAEDVDDRRQLEWMADQVKHRESFMEKISHLETHPEEVSQDEIELLNGKIYDRYSAPVRGKDGKYYGRIWTTHDITARKRAEEQIAEQAALLDKAQDAILELDLENRILFWNHGAQRIYGWTREEVMGQNISNLFFHNIKQLDEINQLTMKHGEWSGKLVHLTKDRREITVESRRTLIYDQEGRPKAILVINTDITEKKKLEAQFMRAQRMESIGTLAGGIAHDLNNILAPIMMSIDVLKVITKEPQAEKILETIEISARRGADIVRQVLSFARGLEGQRVEIQPKHLLKDLEKIIKDTFPKDIRLEFSIPNDTWTILGDPTQVHQILLNLCVNARDAMPNGGNLIIGLENSVLDKQYAAMNIQAKPGRYVQISVTDSGTGMTPELIDKIFEPFFTTKDAQKGTGLGLSTVLAIVKSHQGVINVYSEPGKGSTFKVYLPAMEVSSEEQGEQLQIVELPRGHGDTILVVDDEASILSITAQTLQAFGYSVLTATDGAEAVALYAQHRDKISVVLTDMMMPVMDGPTTIHALLRINPQIKIVAASGLNANGSVAKAVNAGVKHFLAKPYTAGTLLKTMRTILDES